MKSNGMLQMAKNNLYDIAKKISLKSTPTKHDES